MVNPTGKLKDRLGDLLKYSFLSKDICSLFLRIYLSLKSQHLPAFDFSIGFLGLCAGFGWDGVNFFIVTRTSLLFGLVLETLITQGCFCYF